MEYKFPVLYKLDSRDSVREWWIEAKCCDVTGECSYTQNHGLVDGKKQSKTNIVKSGKNIGKSNETTKWEQCLADSESIWTKKRDREGYTESIPTDKPIMPMLAKDYKKAYKSIQWPALSQVKYDGQRCLARITITNNDIHVILKSRKNRDITSLSHIESAIKQSLTSFSLPNHVLILDGELYTHEFADDFQSIISAVKRDKPNHLTSKIQYHIYDMVSDSDYIDRYNWLKQNITENDYIKLVESFPIASPNDIEKQHDFFVEAGYEGMMIRNKKGPYECNRRSKNLQKYKNFMDMEFKIVNAVPDEKLPDQCVLVCVTDKGHSFKVKPEGSTEVREKYWKDWQAGKLKNEMLTVRFFGWTTTDQPVPRFPIGVAVRSFYE